MPKPHDPSKEALSRLDKDLQTFEAKRAAPASMFGGAEAGGEGYRLLAGLIGGVLGGLGLGWVFDHFAHTSPWGLIGGLLIGLVGSIYAAIRSATQMSDRAMAKSGPAPSVPDNDEDE
jgi:ATP synthase protein I